MNIPRNTFLTLDDVGSLSYNLNKRKLICVNDLETGVEFIEDFPIGTIMMFDGSTWVDNVTKKGWYACVSANAAHGCPDLVDKFVMGKVIAGSGSSGGSNTHVIGASEYGHIHTMAHNHDGVSSTYGTLHAHSFSQSMYDSGVNAGRSYGVPHVTMGGWAADRVYADYVNDGIYGGSGGAALNSHVHTLSAATASNTGLTGAVSPSSFDGRPAYYSIVFVRKCY